MKKSIKSIVVVGNRIVIVDGKFLPPLKRHKNSVPRSDFNLLGKAIVGNLGFSELDNEVKVSIIKKKESV